uniref:VWFA domain-containing protein n=1 Tax=Chromera velia CCMP2878 TaxID=1169474 RepID=A0A0G4FVV8_9ALVE|eukprot:Cvel_18889.t1-p1 / transcript=Cvel_18889.t1 / gene=Cvel_18889 / organism=Chromera_velia_CCMP2878 / gene_product=Spondin-1, putative / transcript_product=Spondin-1, putative / location=Cvel_scaffold1591:25088-32463(+) / protein_length=1115 / sequence_SO=supercontig / SO=protein_coding / is_pseudo=false
MLAVRQKKETDTPWSPLPPISEGVEEPAVSSDGLILSRQARRQQERREAKGREKEKKRAAHEKPKTPVTVPPRDPLQHEYWEDVSFRFRLGKEDLIPNVQGIGTADWNAFLARRGCGQTGETFYREMYGNGGSVIPSDPTGRDSGLETSTAGAAIRAQKREEDGKEGGQTNERSASLVSGFALLSPAEHYLESLHANLSLADSLQKVRQFLPDTLTGSLLEGFFVNNMGERTAGGKAAEATPPSRQVVSRKGGPVSFLQTAALQVHTAQTGAAADAVKALTALAEEGRTRLDSTELNCRTELARFQEYVRLSWDSLSRGQEETKRVVSIEQELLQRVSASKVEISRLENSRDADLKECESKRVSLTTQLSSLRTDLRNAKRAILNSGCVGTNGPKLTTLLQCSVGTAVKTQQPESEEQPPKAAWAAAPGGNHSALAVLHDGTGGAFLQTALTDAILRSVSASTQGPQLLALSSSGSVGGEGGFLQIQSVEKGAMGEKREEAEAEATPTPSLQQCTSVGTADCGILLDNLSFAAGRIESTIHRAIAERENLVEGCGQRRRAAAVSLSDTQTDLAMTDAQHGEALVERHRVSEGERRRLADWRQLSADLEQRRLQCEDGMRAAASTVCAAQKVRDQLLKVSSSSIQSQYEGIKDCVVSDWKPASACSRSCGGGLQVLERVVLQAAEKEGAKCPVLSATVPCEQQDCPAECVVSGWAPWSTCSTACGGGIRRRAREVETDPSGGADEDRQTPSRSSCPRLVDFEVCNSAPCTAACTLSEWTDWSPCDKQCSTGYQFSTRFVLHSSDVGEPQQPPTVSPTSSPSAPPPVVTFLQAPPTQVGQQQQANVNIDPSGVTAVTKTYTSTTPTPSTTLAPTPTPTPQPQKPSTDLLDEGSPCPSARDPLRLRVRECNATPCKTTAKCANADMDLMILIDGSASVGSTGFTAACTFASSFVDKRFLWQGKTRNNGRRAGGVIFSDRAYTVSHPIDDSQTLGKAIDKATFPSWTSNLAAAFVATEEIFTSNSLGGSLAVAVLVTDGYSNHDFNAEEAAKRLKVAGVRVMIVAVGVPDAGDRRDAVARWASFPSHHNVLNLKEWADLQRDEVETALTSMMCTELQSA